MKKFVLLSAGALSTVILLIAGCSTTREERGSAIVTEEQLRAPEPPPEEEEIQRGGPQIIVEAPELGSDVSVPVHVRIRFVPERPDAKINPNSLRVRYKIFDVTDEVRKALKVSEEGIEGVITDADPSEYRFKVTISDTYNQKGSAVLQYKVIEAAR